MARTRSNRSGFEQRFLATLRKIGVVRSQVLTLAFSGGVDSLALALATKRVARVLGIELLLVHVDHGLRPESASDADACRRLAEELDVTISVVALEPGLASRTTGIGLEEAARRERYLALARAAKESGSSTLVLGHQANDQAETVLMHLVRGAGLDGMSGMRSKEQRRVPWWTDSARQSVEITLLRPMLAEAKSSIDEYVAASGLRPVEDVSNASTEFDRNWIRLEVLPQLQARWPAGVDSIQRSARAIAHDREMLDKLAASAFSEIARSDRSLCTDAISRLDRAIAFRVLRKWLLTIDADEVNIATVERVFELALSNNEQRSIEVAGGHRLVVGQGRLMTFDTLCQEIGSNLPLVCEPSREKWKVQILARFGSGDAKIEVPVGTALYVRPIEPGDCWSGTNRSVMEDLRAAGIHPLIREKVLAVVWHGGVLLIPAIYPTIRAARLDGEHTRVGVRWSKQS